jgi:Fur family transcriptional regulator, ferric uptake regulator
MVDATYLQLSMTDVKCASPLACQYRFMSRSSTRSDQHVTFPASESFTLESLMAVLRQKGLRITANRRAILKVLLSAKVALSLKQIQAGAVEHRLDGGPPDFVVFRMMTLLEELKLAHKIKLGPGSSHYEMTDSRHHRDYLVCTNCGQLTPLELPCPVVQLERQIFREHRVHTVDSLLGVFWSLWCVWRCRDEALNHHDGL